MVTPLPAVEDFGLGATLEKASPPATVCAVEMWPS